MIVYNIFTRSNNLAVFSMQILIDESGNLGVEGRFFVIAALLPNNPKRIKNIVKRSCIKFGKPNSILDELKGSVLSFPQKQEFLGKLAKEDDFRCHYVVADKKHILQGLLKDNNLCFNYLASHLFKDILRGTNEDIQIVIDERSQKVASVNSLKDYIKIKALTEWGFDKEITFEYKNSRAVKNLQAIDVIANIVYGRYTHNKVNGGHLFNIISDKFAHKIEFPQNKFNT